MSQQVLRYSLGVSALAQEDERELASLLKLLDDPDHRVSEAVLVRLRSKGAPILPRLMEFVEEAADPLAVERTFSLIQEINEEHLAGEFEKLHERINNNDSNTLEDGAFLIAQYGYPALDLDKYYLELSDLAAILRDRVKSAYSPLDLLSITNKFFFEDQGFRGNQNKFLEADNSYINRVLDRRLGIPIALAVVYLLISRGRLGLPFSGAGAPGHFLIRYDGLEEPLFIDAFNRGVILRQEDIKRFLNASGLPFSESFLEPASPRAILLRMIRNLIIVFKETDDSQGQAAFERFTRILAPDSNPGDLHHPSLE